MDTPFVSRDSNYYSESAAFADLVGAIEYDRFRLPRGRGFHSMTKKSAHSRDRACKFVS